MFNTTLVLPRTETRTQYVTREVHEHRAPTDKSVELLKEFEAAASAKIEEAVAVSDTSFSCVVHRLRDMLGDRVILKAIFTMNGKRMTAEFSQNGFDSNEMTLVCGLRDAIAREITVSALKELPWNRIMRGI